MPALAIRSARDLPGALGAALASGTDDLTVDVSALDDLDDVAVAHLVVAVRRARSRGRRVRLVGASETLRRHLQRFDLAALGDATPRRRSRFNPLEALGGLVLDAAAAGRAWGELLFSIVARSALSPRRLRPRLIAREIADIGAEALPILSLIALLIGLIMSFQAAQQLRQFGATIFIADLTGIALTRELGPFITGILVAARSGSSIAAEIGTMKINQEIDAMKTMAIDPLAAVCAPKLIAMLVALPLLVVFADIIGILGGLVIAVWALSLSFDAYTGQLLQAVTVSDVAVGLLKSVVFAAIIASIACYQGMKVRGGSREVAAATTSSVVASIFWMIAANGMLTVFLFYVA